MFGWKYIFIILISLTSSHSYSCGNMSLQKAASYYLQKAAALWLSVVYCPILFQKPFCFLLSRIVLWCSPQLWIALRVYDQRHCLYCWRNSFGGKPYDWPNIQVEDNNFITLLIYR